MIPRSWTTDQIMAGHERECERRGGDAPPPRAPVPVLAGETMPVVHSSGPSTGPLEEGWRPPRYPDLSSRWRAPAGRCGWALPRRRRWPGRYNHPVPGGRPGCGPSRGPASSSISTSCPSISIHGETCQLLAGHASDETCSLAIRGKRSARVDQQPRGRDRRYPEMNRRFPFLPGCVSLMDRGTTAVVHAVPDHGPAVIQARKNEVELISSLWVRAR